VACEEEEDDDDIQVQRLAPVVHNAHLYHHQWTLPTHFAIVASFCTFRDLGQLRQTCRFLRDATTAGIREDNLRNNATILVSRALLRVCGDNEQRRDEVLAEMKTHYIAIAGSFVLAAVGMRRYRLLARVLHIGVDA